MIMKFVLSGIFLTLINFYFDASILSYIGAYALHWWCLDNFESIINIGIFLVRKLFAPCKYQSLERRFGNWAGKRPNYHRNQNRNVFFHLSFSYTAKYSLHYNI